MDQLIKKLLTELLSSPSHQVFKEFKCLRADLRPQSQYISKKRVELDPLPQTIRLRAADQRQEQVIYLIRLVFSNINKHKMIEENLYKWWALFSKRESSTQIKRRFQHSLLLKNRPLKAQLSIQNSNLLVCKILYKRININLLRNLLRVNQSILSLSKASSRLLNK